MVERDDARFRKHRSALKAGGGRVEDQCASDVDEVWLSNPCGSRSRSRER